MSKKRKIQLEPKLIDHLPKKKSHNSELTLSLNYVD